MPVFCKNIAKHLINYQIKFSAALAHLLYDVFTDLAHKHALVPAEKIVKEEQLLIFQTAGADDILVHYVRDEELRQSFGIDDLLARFFDVL